MLVVGSALVGCGGADPAAATQKRCPAARVDTAARTFPLSDLDAGIAQSVVFRNGCTRSRGDLELSLSVRGDSGFSVSPATISIAPGATVTVDVVYAPVGYAPAAAELVAATNDKDVPELTVGLSGTTHPDQDQDGFTAQETGGTDCDDRDPDVRPGAPEVYYDGVDQNCDGASDFDQDRDGADAEPEGDDCDDLDADIGPGVAERDDAVDQDCDGTADEGFVLPGEVVVTEIMAAPAAVDDAVGEWFEVHNVSPRRRNLTGWRVVDDGTDAFVVAAELVLEPDERVVFGTESDPDTNGGAAVDVVYDRALFALDDTADAVRLDLAGELVGGVAYDADWPARAGAALSLDPQFVDSPDATSVITWCRSTTPMSGGDLGTPGAENPNCTNVDHDGDGLSADAGDCDDTRDTVYPGADERWNGIDDDCDEVIDNAQIATARSGYLDGGTAVWLSHPAALSVGDVDNDGDDELIVGSILTTSGYTGVVYTLDASGASSWAGLVEDYDEAALVGSRANDRQAALGALQADVSGDARADLVVGGSGNNDFGGGAAVAVYAVGSAITGALDTTDADATWTGSECHGDCQLTSHVDMDGDGVAEIALGDPAWGGFPARQGRVYLLDAAGASGGHDLDTDAVVTWHGAGPDYDIGSALGGADLDDDGYDELVICGAGATFSYTDAGGCGIIAGSASRPAGGPVQEKSVASIGGSDSGDRIGAVATLAIGDFDGDLELDLAVPNPDADEVLVYLSVGSLAGRYGTAAADVTVAPTVGPARFGASVGAGDVDGDGVDDLVVGAPDTATLGGTDADEAGRVWVFAGPDLTSVQTATQAHARGFVDGESVSGNLGWALLVADLDGDGLDDVVVGAPNHDAGTGRVSAIVVE